MVCRPCRLAGRVGRPFWRAGRGCEALPEGWERSEGPPGGLLGVCRPPSRAGRDRNALPEGGRPFWKVCRVGRPYQWAGRGWESLLESWQW